MHSKKKTASLVLTYFYALQIVIAKIRSFNPPSNFTAKPNLYFIETKWDKIDPTSLESCSVESAARLHPDNQITIYKINQNYDENNSYVRMLLSNFPNIKVVIADLEHLFSSTPLIEWHKRDHLAQSAHPEVHLADAIRLALIWKFGGIYLDTDIIVIRSLNCLRNSIGVENGKILNDPVLGVKYGMRVNNAVLVFDRHFSFIYQYMQRFASRFNSKLFSYNGPVMMTDMLKEICKVDKMNDIIGNSCCMGINVLPRNAFYPVDYLNTIKYYSPAKYFDVDISGSYTLHVNRHGVNGSHFSASEDSMLNRIAKQFCPLTQQIMFKDGRLKDLRKCP